MMASPAVLDGTRAHDMVDAFRKKSAHPLYQLRLTTTGQNSTGEPPMLKFFLADYPGLFLFSLRILGGLFIYKSQWLYGGLA